MNASVCPYEDEIETVMSNFDHEIDRSIERRLRESEAFSRYAGWNFNGRVWWDRAAGEWRCEVWTYGVPHEVIGAEALEEIMQKVCADYGWE